jgi:DNA-binding Lrp family transcriptional regulator
LPSATKNLDTRILKELTSPSSFQWNFRESYSAIAERLEADAETVRVTLRRSVELGLIQDWRLILNPVLFGGKLAGVQLEVNEEARKSKVISQIRLVDGVVEILDFHGASIRVVFYFQDEFDLERKMRLMKSICGHDGEARYWISKLPDCKLKLKNLDWEIISRVMHDPRRDASDVARASRVSSRTVNRRLRRMAEEKVAYLIPVRDIKKWKGIVCSFLIICSEQGRDAIRDFLRSRRTRVDFIFDSAMGTFIATLIANNLSEANELHEKLKALKGISRVEMGLLKEFVFVDDWLDRAVARRMAA